MKGLFLIFVFVSQFPKVFSLMYQHPFMFIHINSPQEAKFLLTNYNVVLYFLNYYLKNKQKDLYNVTKFNPD